MAQTDTSVAAPEQAERDAQAEQAELPEQAARAQVAERTAYVGRLERARRWVRFRQEVKRCVNDFLQSVPFMCGTLVIALLLVAPEFRLHAGVATLVLAAVSFGADRLRRWAANDILAGAMFALIVAVLLMGTLHVDVTMYAPSGVAARLEQVVFFIFGA